MIIREVIILYLEKCFPSNTFEFKESNIIVNEKHIVRTTFLESTLSLENISIDFFHSHDWQFVNNVLKVLVVI